MESVSADPRSDQPLAEQLSTEQRQKIEENRRKAREKLTAKLSAPKKTKVGRQVSRGPGTPSHLKDAASEREAKQSATPVKSKSRGNVNSNTNKISCAVCLGDIIDGKHEAIFCEGECKRWYHRGCASVSQELLSKLTTSDEPFYCLMCSREIFKQEVNRLVAEIDCLKAEVKVIPAMQASIEALKGELAELRNNNSAAATVTTYAKAVSKSLHPRSHPANSNLSKLHNTVPLAKAQVQAQVAATSPATSGSGGNSEKVRALGVRRVWRTMRSATASTVSSTLKKLTSIGSKLSIRRRSRPGSNSGKSTYWFIIRSNENILQKLDEEWDQVQMQIGWKLENCYRPMPSQQVQAHDEDKQTSGGDEKAPAPIQNKAAESPKKESPKHLSPAEKPLQNSEASANELSDGVEELLEVPSCSLSPITVELGSSTPTTSQD